MQSAPEILTVGHSTHPIERFAELLGAGRVELVADVRRYPGSRRNPQFGAGALASSLRDAGIAYAALGERLGGRRSSAGSEAAAASGWRNRSFAAYAEYMQGPDFAAGLAELEELARERRTAIMCAEGDWHRCHRRLIASALSARGWRVDHLLARGGTEEHPPAVPGLEAMAPDVQGPPPGAEGTGATHSDP